MNLKSQVQWHADPGHAWLEVSKETIKKLGISKKISHYSYQNDDKVFLEEDCDAYIFFEHYFHDKDWFQNKTFMKEAKSIPEIFTNEDSKIRNYTRYKA